MGIIAVHLLSIFVLGLEPYYSSARAVNKEPSIRSSRKFQGWNSPVPAVELDSTPYLQAENMMRQGGDLELMEQPETCYTVTFKLTLS